MSGVNILVADADPTFLDEARATLEEEGYRVRIAPDGRAALASAQEHPPDLIVADMRLPRLDGWKLVKRVRAIEGLRSVPVVFLSERSSDTTRRQALKVGVDDMLLKPVHPETLAFRVAKALARRYRVERTQRKLKKASDTRRLVLANLPTKALPRRPSPPSPKTAPATPQVRVTTESAALSGQLEHVSLPTVLGMIDVENMTGRLTVVNAEAGSIGWIEVRNGRATRARMDDGADASSKTAIIAMLGWTVGAFRFFIEPVDGSDEIGWATPELLIEGARMADESARIATVPADVAEPPTQPPGPELPHFGRSLPRETTDRPPEPAAPIEPISLDEPLPAADDGPDFLD